MAFITADDYKAAIKETNLTRMLDNDTAAREDAEATAIATIRDSLFSRYDTDVIFGSEGDDRPKQVVRWVIVLSLYYLYERLPQTMMPDRIKNNYEQLLGWLVDIEDGKKALDLPRRTQADADGTQVPITKFRHGSSLPPRSHSL